MLISNVKKIIKSNNCPNLLLYGNDKIYNSLINMLNELFNVKNVNIIENSTFKYIGTLNYFAFENILNKNFKDFKNSLSDLVLTDNFFIKNKKIIILNNIILNELNQKCLKNIIEKNKDIKFIIITNNYNNLYYHFKSIFLSIRLNVIDEIKKVDNILTKNDLYSDIYNYVKIIFCLKINKSNIKKIKDFSYLLLLNNIGIRYIYIIILDILLDKKYSDLIIFKIINFFNELSQFYKNSYYKLIYYEYIFLSCNKILN